MANQQRWARIVGDGAVFSGPCLVMHVIFWPSSDTQYTDIYDGRDAIAGKQFCRLEAITQETQHLDLRPGVPFDVGIYVDAESGTDETTVLFIPD